MNEKLSFLYSIVGEYVKGQTTECPYCGSTHTKTIANRRLVIQLKQCDNCGLMFRYPKETIDFNAHYYQEEYDEGITTQMPDLNTLNSWKSKGFKGSPRDFSTKVSIVKAVVPSGKLLDFGASWGYASYQFMLAGYDVLGYEISRPRARYANENLQVPIVTSMSELLKHEASFDAIFTSHVLEHCPNFREILDAFYMLLKPSGKLIAMVPNCKSNRQIMSMGFGMHHIFAFNQSFFSKNLTSHGFSNLFFASSPYNDEFWDRLKEGRSLESIDGDELLFIASKS
ncbi:MAG: class I SAM-dependent methyltransferase [Chloroherpetonaceae bacterium]